MADVAWCKPNDPGNCSQNIGAPPVTPTGECDIDYDVSKLREVDVWAYGKKSQWMSGRAVALASHWMKENIYSLPEYFFINQLELRLDKIAEGDSGAILMRKRDNRICGIITSLDIKVPGLAFATPWSAVLKCSQLQFKYDSVLS
jgi:hypothetical protein